MLEDLHRYKMNNTTSSKVHYNIVSPQICSSIQYVYGFPPPISTASCSSVIPFTGYSTGMQKLQSWLKSYGTRQRAGIKLDSCLKVLRGEKTEGRIYLLLSIINPYYSPSTGHIESQNVRGWKGPLWVPQSNPPAKAGSPRAGCTAPHPGES